MASYSNEKLSVEELSTLNKEVDNKKPEKKKHPKLKFLIYFLVILIATGLALFFSLKDDFNGVISAIKSSEKSYLALILGLVAASYCIDAFVVFIFSRLYTRSYKYHQGLATSMIGSFYSAVTPGASGGQIMQVYTMKKQGVDASNGASIMIMSFIVYQCALISIGVVSLFFSAGDLISSIGTFHIPLGGDNAIDIPAIPLTIAGFLLNVIVILGLFLMSYSHKFHNFIMHYGISLLAKIHILKNPDKKRESLRIQVENFKIELRRLLSNIPVLLVVFICYLLILIIRFSIPFFAGLALNGYNDTSLGQFNIQSFWQAVFLSSYHQMTTGLLPLPGSAGVSEYFFNLMFGKFYCSASITNAAQIIWRFSTFHIVLLISGIVAATYHSSPKNEIQHANRKTFVTLQYETYAKRKASSDTMFETSSLSAKEIQKRIKMIGKKKTEERIDDFDEIPDLKKPIFIDEKKSKKTKKKSESKPKEKEVIIISSEDDD